jgi:hypothetical protein
MPDGSLIRVQTDVVLDVLVASIHAEAAARADLQDGDWMTAVGWHVRDLERRRFARAREPMPWLAELLAAEGLDVAARLAAEEPAGRPEPGEAPSWRVPGPGGHVRHYLALRAVDEALHRDPEADRVALKRAWMTGFFTRCCEELQEHRESRIGAP